LRDEGQALARIDDGSKPGAQPAKLIGTQLQARQQCEHVLE